ncbi:MAG: hypothetical protein KME54_15755 [Tolypothrix brevis GSE-NOS-MK-07-07A]|jgi:hypothetical protein|nr:hypothetical protein [Tolypothrix brevis GSE-NOS-MK-07-07A]
MWLLKVTCSSDAWKHSGVEFKTMTDKYQGDCISSKRMPDGTRIMEYKIKDVSDVEAFYDECASLAGFTAYFESF